MAVLNKNLSKSLSIFIVVIIGVIAIDQIIKLIILEGFRFDCEAFSITLVYNKGVAFSMFAFLDSSLKWIQIALLGAIFIYMICNIKLLEKYKLALGLILGGGISNVIDRFIHEGVVDYVAWHYWFNFAVFNFADVMIDLGVVILIIMWLKEKNGK